MSPVPAGLLRSKPRGALLTTSLRVAVANAPSGRAGVAVVLAIFVAACVASYEDIVRLIHQRVLSHLWALAAAALVCFIGNELTAQVRLRGREAPRQAALVADGHHARADGLVSLGVVAGALMVALGARLADLLIGLAIALFILRITLDSWRTVKHDRTGARGAHAWRKCARPGRRGASGRR